MLSGRFRFVLAESAENPVCKFLGKNEKDLIVGSLPAKIETQWCYFDLVVHQK